MQLKDKIKILRANRGWTQAMLAEKVYKTESAIQKWEKGSSPGVDGINTLAEVFEVSPVILIDDAVEVYEIVFQKTRPGCVFNALELEDGTIVTDSDHQVYAAGLEVYAELHRFENPAGEPYSAIYVGREEKCSCERDHEHRMIDYWNDIGWK